MSTCEFAWRGSTRHELTSWELSRLHPRVSPHQQKNTIKIRAVRRIIMRWRSRFVMLPVSRPMQKFNWHETTASREATLRETDNQFLIPSWRESGKKWGKLLSIKQSWLWWRWNCFREVCSVISNVHVFTRETALTCFDVQRKLFKKTDWRSLGLLRQPFAWRPLGLERE